GPEPWPAHLNRHELLEAARRALGREPDPTRVVADDSAEVVHAYLRSEFRFTPSLIHVKEFATRGGLAVYHLPYHYAEIARDPDALTIAESEEDRRGMRAHFSRGCIHGDFVIEWGNDYWAGPHGEIHSS